MIKKFIVFILLLFAIFLFYSTQIEPSFVTVNNKTIHIPNWKDELNGFKIGIISDLHIGSRKVDLKKVEKIVNLMNAQNPDLIVLLGDFDPLLMHYSRIEPADISASLRKLKARYGVISILGNHDYKPEGIIQPMLLRAGINVLENESTYIFPKNKKVRIVGLKDHWFFWPDPAKEIGKTEKNVPVILLGHNPDIFPKVPKKVSLTLSGHTHGGEVSLPIAGSPTVPSKYGQRYAKGYIVENNKHLFVTKGIGTTSGLRFGNVPEIAVLTLYNQNDKTKITYTNPKFGFRENHIPKLSSLWKFISGNYSCYRQKRLI